MTTTQPAKSGAGTESGAGSGVRAVRAEDLSNSVMIGLAVLGSAFLAAASSGCTSSFPSTGVPARHSSGLRGRAAQRSIRTVARPHLTAEPATATQPAYYSPTPGMQNPVVLAAPDPRLTDDELIAAWDALQDPRLRWMQILGLRTIPSGTIVDQRLRLSGLLARVASSDPAYPRERLLHAIAHGVVEARYHQHRQLTLQTELKMLREKLEQIKIRVQAGSV
ncbi:MAG: hypothetical protein AAFV88_05805, partial [Planctomycetota bacterium]